MQIKTQNSPDVNMREKTSCHFLENVRLFRTKIRHTRDIFYILLTFSRSAKQNSYLTISKLAPRFPARKFRRCKPQDHKGKEKGAELPFRSVSCQKTTEERKLKSGAAACTARTRDFSGGKSHFPGRKIVSLQILRPEAVGFK